MDIIELIAKAREYKEKAEMAEGDERVEFVIMCDDYCQLVIRELPSLLCQGSKLKCDIIFW